MEIRRKEFDAELNLSKYLIAQDRKYRLAKALIARSVVPLALLGMQCRESAPLNKAAVVNSVVDISRLMAAASATVNLVRRDVIPQV